MFDYCDEQQCIHPFSSSVYCLKLYSGLPDFGLSPHRQPHCDHQSPGSCTHSQHLALVGQTVVPTCHIFVNIQVKINKIHHVVSFRDVDRCTFELWTKLGQLLLTISVHTDMRVVLIFSSYYSREYKLSYFSIAGQSDKRFCFLVDLYLKCLSKELSVINLPFIATSILIRLNEGED